MTNLKLVVNEGQCTLLGTNAEQYVKTNIPSQSYDSCRFVFEDTAKLMKAMKFFRESDIQFEFNGTDDTDGNIKIQCGNKTAEMQTIEANVFPEFPVIDNDEQYRYTASKLTERYDRVKYAVSHENTKPVLTGIHFDMNNMVTLDGYRLALNSDDDLIVNTAFTVPEIFIKLCADLLIGSIEIKQSKRYISVSDLETTIISRLFEQNYVKYMEVLPKDGNLLRIDKTSFVEGLQYFKALTSKGTRKNAAIWSQDKLTFKDENSTYAASFDYEGQFDYEIAFNLFYMLDAMDQFKDKTIQMYMGQRKVNPMMIKDEHNVALVLPVNLDYYY
jgi:DNA polymerase-3 subunit beta